MEEEDVAEEEEEELDGEEMGEEETVKDGIAKVSLSIRP